MDARFRVRPHAGQIDGVSASIVHLDLVGQDAVVDGTEVRCSELWVSGGGLCALNESQLAHLILLRIVVQVRVEHYSRVCEQKGGVFFVEQAGLCRIECVGERLHTPFNRSRLAGQPETLKEHTERVVESKPGEYGHSDGLHIFP